MNDFFDSLLVPGLSSVELKQIAFNCHFIRRRARKIDALHFLALMCLESLKGSPSYNDLVSRFDTVYHISASKQAVWKKVNESCYIFFQSVLAQLIKAKVSDKELPNINALAKYKRIIIQDSTIIKLPLRLFSAFSGVSNNHSSACNVRIQGVYDLLSGRFLHFSIDPYSKNDLLAAPELEIHRADLVLRDRGYYTNGEMKRHTDLGADCIYRHKQKVLYLDPLSGKPLQLLSLLEQNNSLDMPVCLNDKARTKVRLLAAPVSQQVADNRRRRAKKEMKGHNPPKELLKLMAWTLFITNIPSGEGDFEQIFKLYRIRWQIEIIFKTWKSYMHLAKVHNVSYVQLQVLLTARFIMIVICTHNLYLPWSKRVEHKYIRHLSMMKFMSYIIKNPEKIMELISCQTSERSTLEIIDLKLIRYCSYEKRSRLNIKQMQYATLLS